VQWTEGSRTGKRTDAVIIPRECLRNFQRMFFGCRNAPHNWFHHVEEQLPGGKTLSLPYRGDALWDVGSLEYNRRGGSGAARTGSRYSCRFWVLSGAMFRFGFWLSNDLNNCTG